MDNELDNIRELRKSLTLSQIGAQYNKTGERIRQLLLKQSSRRCNIHDVFITNKCTLCQRIEQRRQLVQRLKKDGVYRDIDRLSTRRRTREISLERIKLVKKLHDSPYKMSYRQIAKHLHRDHATIIYLCTKKT